MPSMGEYASYIWSSYGIAFFVMIALVIATRVRLRSAQKKLSVLEAAVRPNSNTEDQTS